LAEGIGRLDSVGSEQGPVAGSYENGDEHPSSGAIELISCFTSTHTTLKKHFMTHMVMRLFHCWGDLRKSLCVHLFIL
jgi:hypothetical protein